MGNAVGIRVSDKARRKDKRVPVVSQESADEMLPITSAESVADGNGWHTGPTKTGQ